MLLLNKYALAEALHMNLLPRGVVVLALCSCSAPSQSERIDIVGMSSFALAARYGTPASYQHQGEYLQLNYGNELWGCRVVFLLDKHQRVVGVASSGSKCGPLP
ncbi:hypothetical protein [Janthinobacterium lividum]|uniref:hypothetical protein n=1 Tax=Janthinobacterium lividum TaxID=29581 RepID=UPI001595B45D|nr:hypothetical protein [Janthinobacterium lividum]QKY09488.1 hypothetical protein G8765_18175 [Janthinobacterium lividum]